MKEKSGVFARGSNRRSFLRNGAVAAGAATLGAGLVAGKSFAFDRDREDNGPGITRGDIAILTFLQALEQVEADLWQQYSELGGIQDNEVSGVNGGNVPYTQALLILDGDMAQYIHDNADDENSHVSFLGKYLESKGAEPADLSAFKTLPSSKADGARQVGRLTNLTQLTVDTSFWSRYRSITNPDFDPNAPFVQAVPSLNVGQHTAIPRSNDDTAGSVINPDPTQSTFTDHLKAIAFTAGFHFAFIEQGGSSLYPILSLKATDEEVLRILLSIGGVEIDHFGLWHDKAGNAVNAPLAGVVDPITGLTFPNLNNPAIELTQTNKILPEPCTFLSKSLPACSVIRPTLSRNGGPVATVKAFTADGLFQGQSNAFFKLAMQLARAAEGAQCGL